MCRLQHFISDLSKQGGSCEPHHNLFPLIPRLLGALGSSKFRQMSRCLRVSSFWAWELGIVIQLGKARDETCPFSLETPSTPVVSNECPTIAVSPTRPFSDRCARIEIVGWSKSERSP